VFISDFVLRHDDRTEILIEIAGFWTADYWTRERGTLKAFADCRIVLAIPKSTEATDIEASFPVIRDGTQLRVKRVTDYPKLCNSPLKPTETPKPQVFQRKLRDLAQFRQFQLLSGYFRVFLTLCGESL
jgi:predicted nuclease of restriction endonuclease-like RecB superfamily